MKRLLTILTLGLLLLPLAAEDVYLVKNRTDRSPSQDWSLNSSKYISMEQVAWPDDPSQLAVKFTYKPCPDGWPSAKVYPSGVLKDWSKAKTITIPIYCEIRSKIGIKITTDTNVGGDGNKIQKSLYSSESDVIHEPGTHTLVFDLAAITDMDLSAICYLDIFADKPSDTYSIYVGDITLQVQTEEELAAKRAAAVQEIARGYQWRMAALSPQAPSPEKNFQPLLKLLAKDSSTFTDDAQVSSLQAAADELFPQLDKLLFQRQAALHNGLGALWCLPEEKVLRNDYTFYDAPTPEYTLDAARGEGESAQLVAFATEALSGVSAKVLGQPTMADGTTLPTSAITLSPVGYVTISNPQYTVDPLGYWPDPILEYLQKPIALEKETYQSWWLDVQVPADQKPGLYQGTVQLSDTSGPNITLPFTVRVHEFSLAQGAPYFSPTCLPYETQIQKVIAQNAGESASDYAARIRTYWKDIASMLLQNRIDPAEIYFFMDRSSLVDNAKWLLEHGANGFNMGFINFNNREGDFVNQEMTDTLAAQITDAYNRCKEAGILDKAYIYCFDEATPDKFSAIKTALERARKLAPDIPIYTTLYDGSFGVSSGLDAVIDGWIPLNTSYEKNANAVTQARARGDKVCWYVCCNPQSPYANLLLDQPAAAHRLLMGFMAKKYAVEGFLYYRACGWVTYDESNNYKDSYITTPVDGDSTLLATPWIGEAYRKYPGDGRLIYPGKEAPLPTQRLKNMRDGMDDWMYLGLLEKALATPTNMPDEWKARATQELQIEESLVTSLSEWTQEPAPIQAKKLRIAELLDQYAQKNP